MSEERATTEPTFAWGREPAGVSFVHGGASVRVTFLTPHIVRVVHGPPRDFVKLPSAMILPDQGTSEEFSLTEDEQRLTLASADLALLISKRSGAFAWCDATGRLLVHEPEHGGRSLQVYKAAGNGDAIPEERLSDPGSLSERTLFTTRHDLRFCPGEALYGLGQHEEGIIDYRGHCQYLYQHNLKVAAPVLVSSRGYGIFWDTTAFSAFHDDEHGSYFWTEADRALDFYFIFGPSFDRIVAGLRKLTGRPPLPPRWSFGYVQSKERYKTQAELTAVAREFRRRRLPLDCIVQDWQSWTGDQWGDKTPDPVRYPNPTALVEDLHAMGVRLMVSLWPTLHGEGRDRAELRDRGFLLGNDATYDAFQPEARALYFEQAERGWLGHGVDALWCDCTEPFEPDWDWTSSLKPEPWQRVHLNTSEPKRFLPPDALNAYSLHHSRGAWEHLRKATPDKRVLNLTRSALPGQQRYGTITWSGDTSATWRTLGRQIPAALGFTVTGNPRWTMDIGGFFVDGKKPWFWRGDYPEGVKDAGYRELYVRWLQLATFLPMMRAHGTDTPREPWRFGEPGDPIYDTIVAFLELRYRLLPYLYSLAAAETLDDYTMLRLLAFDFREDPNVYRIRDQFMLGPALLVCPVTRPMYYAPGSRALDGMPKSRRIYLPAGADWYDFFTGARHRGGQVIVADAPLERIPLFVRAGSLLPLGPIVEHTGASDGAALELRVYPGADSEFELYFDEGDGHGYEAGACSRTRVALRDADGEIVVGPARGEYPGMPRSRELAVVFVREGHGVGIAPSSEPEVRLWAGSEEARFKR